MRWAQQIPRADLAASYHAPLKLGGRAAKLARLVFGALIIKHQLSLTDTENLEQLRESLYLQYFCGFGHYQYTTAFAPTLFVKRRGQLSHDRFAAFKQGIIDRVEQARRRSVTNGASEASDDSLTA